MTTTGDIATRLQILEDKDAIRGLLIRAGARSTGRTGRPAIGYWHPEAEFSFGPWEPLRGRDAIRKAVEDAESPYAAMMHYVHNIHFEIDGDRATGVGYMLFVGVPDGTDAGDHFDMGGSYDWEFVRTPEGWRMLKQHLTLTWRLGVGTLGAFVDA